VGCTASERTEGQMILDFVGNRSYISGLSLRWRRGVPVAFDESSGEIDADNGGAEEN
jgi:hypothetical protein